MAPGENLTNMKPATLMRPRQIYIEQVRISPI